MFCQKANASEVHKNHNHTHAKTHKTYFHSERQKRVISYATILRIVHYKN